MVTKIAVGLPISRKSKRFIPETKGESLEDVDHELEY